MHSCPSVVAFASVDTNAGMIKRLVAGVAEVGAKIGEEPVRCPDPLVAILGQLASEWSCNDSGHKSGAAFYRMDIISKTDN